MLWLLLPLILRVSVTCNTATLVAGHLGSKFDNSGVEVVEREKLSDLSRLPHAPDHEIAL